MASRLTKRWIRNASDERAAENGCWFDAEAAILPIWWMERCLVLYEGNNAGDAMHFRSCQTCDNDSACFTRDEQGFLVPKYEEFNDAAKSAYLKRLDAHNRCFQAGHDLDWQFECHARLYGWQRIDDDWSSINGYETVVRRFSQAVVIIAKKNKKSPTLAANALYLSFGEGEPGAKTFLFAVDGQQARKIAGEHCIKMVERSPVLQNLCKINKTTGEIIHDGSLVSPMSSGDDRHQKAKEGINGNIMVDEIHVVDRKAMKRVDRAGISRQQPLQGEFSTAGDDPDGYGYHRVDYCRKVIAGEIEDQRLFAAIYEAPQDLTDDQLAKDPLRYARMANPAWGHTIRESEIMADYESAKNQGKHELAICKKYRFNIWLTSSNPMIDPDAWAAAARGFTIEDFYDRPVTLGLDIAKVNDFSAAVFTTEIDGIKHQFPFFWITRKYQKENRNLVIGFYEWEHTGELIVVDGVRVHEQDIVDGLLPHIRKFRSLPMLVYDETFAADIAVKIQDAAGGEKSCDLFPMAQTHAKYTEPTTEFLDDLNDGKLAHPNNECFNWQARNVYLDLRGELCKPMRENQNEDRHKKIDGIQAAVMSHLAWRRRPERTSVYNERGVISIG